MPTWAREAAGGLGSETVFRSTLSPQAPVFVLGAQPLPDAATAAPPWPAPAAPSGAPHYSPWQGVGLTQQQAQATTLRARLDKNRDGVLGVDEFADWFAFTCAEMHRYREQGAWASVRVGSGRHPARRAGGLG